MLFSQVMLIDKKKEQKESVFLHFCTSVCSLASTLYIAGVALLPVHCLSPFVCPKVSHSHVLLCPVLMDLPFPTKGWEAVCPGTSCGTAGMAGAGGNWGEFQTLLRGKRWAEANSWQCLGCRSLLRVSTQHKTSFQVRCPKGNTCHHALSQLSLVVV